MIRLNNISESVFNADASLFGGSRERADIISCGRLLMAERNGRDHNAMRALQQKPAEHMSRIDDVTYARTNSNFQKKFFLYAAKLTCNQTGELAPETYEDFLKRQRRFLSDRSFLRVLAGIVTEIVTPVLPAVMSNALDYLAETVYVPLGQTYEINIASNDIFLFEDDSWGASRSKPSNYLYDYPLTLNPQPSTAKATVKWYQMVANDADLGRIFNAIAAGLYSKIMALWTQSMLAASDDTRYIQTALSFQTNSAENWTQAVQLLSAANRTSYRNTIAFGTLVALSKVLPTGVVNASTVNLDAALSTMLGIEWARYGYLAEYMGAKLMPIENVLVPGTQNTTMTQVLPDDRIWLMSAGGYKPIYIAMEEGTPITIQLDPRETADMTIDIIVTASMDVKPVFGSKVATMAV